jgi:ABC-type branched-subunit amino acid transport system permease subunit
MFLNLKRPRRKRPRSSRRRASLTSWTGTRSPPALVLAAVPQPDLHAHRGALVSVLLALLIGVAMFRRRVGGTYFAIITQAIAAILTILIIGQQGYTGGVNGITDVRTSLGWDIRSDHAKDILYFVKAGLLIVAVLVAQFIRRSKLGRILVRCAIRRTGCGSRATPSPISRFSYFAARRP